MGRSQIKGEFQGFDENTLFKLTDGSYWLQDEYQYWYHYAYRPWVVILERNGRYYLTVDGQSQTVAVRQVYDVIESHIDGEFTGWVGDSAYRLGNGQVWKQSVYAYEYRYAYRPTAVVYRENGGYVMEVQGTRAKVVRVS